LPGQQKLQQWLKLGETNPAKEVGISMLGNKRYDEMVEDATVDCHDMSEEIAGFLAMLQENTDMPFDAQVVGCDVKVIDFAMDNNRVLAKVTRDNSTFRVDLRDVAVEARQSQEWVATYQRWRKEWS
jgi:hypothetical protein